MRLGSFPDDRGIVIDLFAGGGGASTGLSAAIGRDPDVANNHDKLAMTVYSANHPSTLCLPEDVWQTPPEVVLDLLIRHREEEMKREDSPFPRRVRRAMLARARRRKVWMLWASPDCTHFSKAKGSKPRQKKIRALAHVVVRYARELSPELIFLENVKEFQEWGPLYAVGHTMPDGRVLAEGDALIDMPIPERRGEYFNTWRGMLEVQGYRVEWKLLRASAYGAPTSRERLFLVARRDGQPVEWPAPTHGTAPGLLPVRTAAECIDWSLPVPSIFGRKRPLAAKTLWRIAQGIRKYVLENPRPFIVGVGGRAGQTPPTDVAAPVGTITAKNDRAVVVPSLVKVNHGGPEARGESIGAPLSTVTAERRGHALIAPTLVRTAHGERDKNGRKRGRGGLQVEESMPTVLASNDLALIAPTLVCIDQQSSSSAEHSPTAPVTTITAKARHAIVAASMVQTGYGERKGQRARHLDLEQPLGTVMATGQKHALVTTSMVEAHPDSPHAEEVAAFIVKNYGGHTTPGTHPAKPLDTITARDHHSLAAVTMAKIQGDSSAFDAREPVPTVVAGGRHVAEVHATLQPAGPVEVDRTAEVRAFLTAYYGSGSEGQVLDEPMRTITSLRRLGIVVIESVHYQIVDIGLRMLEPHELLAAQFGKYAAGYDMSAATSKAKKVKLIGNSVCPEAAEALVRANVVLEPARRKAA